MCFGLEWIEHIIILLIVGMISCVKVSAAETAISWPDNMPRPLLRVDCGTVEGTIKVKVQLGQYISNTFAVSCTPA